jgi:hypothetical protein
MSYWVRFYKQGTPEEIVARKVEHDFERQLPQIPTEGAIFYHRDEIFYVAAVIWTHNSTEPFRVRLERHIEGLKRNPV